MKVSYAGVDWITMTTKEEKYGRKWWDIYAAYRKQKEIEGGKAQQFHNGWYAGERIEKLRWGHNPNIGYIMVASGRDAERLYQRFQPTKSKVTRLDLCFDFIFSDKQNLAEKLYKGLQEGVKNRQRKSSLFRNSSGGATLYIGSRQSDQFGRLYDKGVQSKTNVPGKHWRAEVEYKKPRSGNINRSLYEVSRDDRENKICDTVAEWFADRNAELFPSRGTFNTLHYSVEARQTTADRKLAWLRTQVAPSVRQLVEAGYGREVLDNLLLDVQTISKALQG